MLMVPSFVCWLNLLVNQKEGAQKQRGHLVAWDANCSFGMPICHKKNKKEGRENWQTQIV